MNKELRNKWVTALRSGEYKQGRKQLYHAGRFCCLGVLADIKGEPVRKTAWNDQEQAFYWIHGPRNADYEIALRLAEMNDKGVESERAALKKYPRGKK